MHRIVLLGPPASGKGTQSKRISEILGISSLSTGNLLRREVERDSEIGREVESYLNDGRYVPDELILRIVRAWLLVNSGGWLLDGFPRTRTQAEALEQLGGVEGPTLAIGLDVGREDLEKRMNSRRECGDCGEIVSVSGSGDHACPRCGGRLERRSDDVLESFKVRYENYEALTLPLFDYYEKKGILARVDGSLAPDAVFSQIKEHLNQ